MVRSRWNSPAYHTEPWCVYSNTRYVGMDRDEFQPSPRPQSQAHPELKHDDRTPIDCAAVVGELSGDRVKHAIDSMPRADLFGGSGQELA